MEVRRRFAAISVQLNQLEYEELQQAIETHNFCLMRFCNPHYSFVMEDVREQFKKKELNRLSVVELQALKERLYVECPGTMIQRRDKDETKAQIRNILGRPTITHVPDEHKESFNKTVYRLMYLSDWLFEVNDGRHVMLPSRMRLAASRIDGEEYSDYIPDFD